MAKDDGPAATSPASRSKAAPSPDALPDEPAIPIPEELQAVAKIDWSIRGLEALGVPAQEAPHILGRFALMVDLAILPGAVLKGWTAESGGGELGWLPAAPQVVELLEQVRLHLEHPDIPIADARRLARALAFARLRGDEPGKTTVQEEERFEPWRSKDHATVFKEYMSRRRSTQQKRGR